MIGHVEILCFGDCGCVVDDDNRVLVKGKEYCSHYCSDRP